MRTRPLVAALAMALGAGLPVTSYAQAGGSATGAAVGGTSTGTASTSGIPSTTTSIGTTNAAGTTSPSTQSTTTTQNAGVPRATGTVTTNTTGGTTQNAVTSQSSTSTTPAIGVTSSSSNTVGGTTTQSTATASASGNGRLSASASGTPGSNVTLAIPGGGPSASDQLLLDQLLAALGSDPALAGSEIKVVVDSGRVTLSGTALSAEQAARARSVAQGVTGANRVASNITPRA